MLFIIYFLKKSLKELDIKALQVLSAKVNIIPVIAKADTLTQEEKASFKKTVSFQFLFFKLNFLYINENLYKIMYVLFWDRY
jgi:septin family protein